MPCMMIDCARLSFSSTLTSMNASAFFSSTTSASSVWLIVSSLESVWSCRRTSTFAERLAVGREEPERRARRMQMLHDALDDEAEQLVHRPVFDQLAGEERRASAAARCRRSSARSVDLVDRDGDRGAGLAIRDGDEAVGVVLGRLEDDLRVAEADAVAGA